MWCMLAVEEAFLNYYIMILRWVNRGKAKEL